MPHSGRVGHSDTVFVKVLFRLEEDSASVSIKSCMVHTALRYGAYSIVLWCIQLCNMVHTAFHEDFLLKKNHIEVAGSNHSQNEVTRLW